MEGLGEQFQKARAARNLTLDEAARMTKIRPNKLAEIEAEDFSHFPSLAYAKGFVLIYGKFLNVDVSPYLEAFETSEHMTVDGYSYLQDNPAPKPRRTEVVRREPSGNKSSLMPLVIGVVVLVAGFTLLKLIMDIRRIKPSARERDSQALAHASAAASPTIANTGGVTAPRALPADATPPMTGTTPPVPNAEPVVQSTATPPLNAAAPTPLATPQPSAAAMAELEGEPEVRRAEPVNPDDLKKAQATLAAVAPSAAPVANRYDIRPLKKTYVKVTVDNQAGGSSFERWLEVSAGPVQLTGKRITVKVLDPSAVEIRKNGRVINAGDVDVRLE